MGISQSLDKFILTSHNKPRTMEGLEFAVFFSSWCHGVVPPLWAFQPNWLTLVWFGWKIYSGSKYNSALHAVHTVDPSLEWKTWSMQDVLWPLWSI